jgi:hypothetical protein
MQISDKTTTKRDWCIVNIKIKRKINLKNRSNEDCECVD